jgi:hypothetical protein
VIEWVDAEHLPGGAAVVVAALCAVTALVLSVAYRSLLGAWSARARFAAEETVIADDDRARRTAA